MAIRHSKRDALIPAVGYIRRSTSKQEKSLADQRREIERYAKQHGYVILRWYVDDGISGDSTECRNGFLDMHAAACNGRDFDVILAWDSKRFGRFDSIESGYWIFPLRKAGVKLVTVADGVVDWDDFGGRIMNAVQAEGGHQFLLDQSRNTSRGLITNAKNGHLCGQRENYGYDRMVVDERGNHVQRIRHGERTVRPRSYKVVLVPSDDPEKVATLKWLFKTYADTDVGMRTLADQLNERGIPGPTGGAWYAATIREILKNDKYVGTFAYNKRRHGKYHRMVGEEIRKRDRAEVKLMPCGKPNATFNPQEAWISTENAHEALIDVDTFDRVQAKREERKRRNNYGYPTHTKSNGDAYLLTGLVFCQHCGEKMHGTPCSRTKNGKTYRYPKYICSTYNRCGKNNPHGCGCHGIHQADIVDVLVRKLRDSMLVGGNRQKLRAVVKQQLSARRKPDKRRLDDLRRRLRELDQNIDRAAERLLTAPDDLMDTLAPKVTAMKNERQRVAVELSQAETAAAPMDLDATADAIVDRVWRLGDELKNAEPARLRELFKQMVARIELRFDHVQRGKRLECPFSAGVIHLRSDSPMSSCVSRGERI